METLIQAGELGLPVESVPISTNPKTRESRLIIVHKTQISTIRSPSKTRNDFIHQLPEWPKPA